MDVYLVGGAVRDQLLGLEVRERDWVVVGSEPAELDALGYRPVGKDFPVFLHPKSGEEYALARTERKTGKGYHGFAFYAERDVSLEDDLCRRDLTINAIAQATDGQLIDPYGGVKDIEQRVLRHVSDAFVEDPLRVLRVARFAARFHALGFSIHPTTQDLLRTIVSRGELEALKPERVWAETLKAIATDKPSVYFEALRSCGGLDVLFPWLEALYGVPQPAQWHPEIDTGVHTMMVLDAAAKLSERADVRVAALTHDLGKGTTPPEIWPSHKGHEERSVQLLSEWTSRYPVANQHRELAVLVARWHGQVHRVKELKASTVLRLFESCDAFRRAERFENFLVACEADARGRTGFEDAPYPQADILRRAFSAAAGVSSAEVARDGLEGPAFGEALRRRRLTEVKRSLGTTTGDQAAPS